MTVAELKARLQDAGGEIRTLRGLAKVKVANDEEQGTVSQVLLAEYPDHLRAETLSPFGSPLLVLASDGRDLEVLLAGAGRFLRGPASVENLQRFTRLPLRLTDLVGLLLYRVPVFPSERDELGSGGPDGYLLVLQGPPPRRQEFSFDRALRLSGAAYFRDDELLLRVDYREFREGSPLFPGTVDLSMPQQHLTAILSFSMVDLNADLPAERFHLTPPPGVAVEALP